MSVRRRTESEVLCERVDEAFESGDQDKTLREVQRLAQLKVRHRMANIGRDGDARRQDVVQKCLIAIWRSNFERRPPAKYSHWVCGVINNKIREEFREVQKDLKVVYLSEFTGFDEEGVPQTLLESIESGETKLIRSSLAIGTYPCPEAYEAFSLQAEGWNQKQIAAKLGRTYAAFRKQMSRWTDEIERDIARRMARLNAGLNLHAEEPEGEINSLQMAA